MANISAFYPYSAAITTAPIVQPAAISLSTNPAVSSTLPPSIAYSLYVVPVKLSFNGVGSPKPSDIQNPPKSFGFPS